MIFQYKYICIKFVYALVTYGHSNNSVIRRCRKNKQMYFYLSCSHTSFWLVFGIIHQFQIQVWILGIIFFLLWPSIFCGEYRSQSQIIYEYNCNLKNDRMISVHFQGKPFNITVIQVYAPTSNTKEAEVKLFYNNI